MMESSSKRFSGGYTLPSCSGHVHSRQSTHNRWYGAPGYSGGGPVTLPPFHEGV